MSLSGPTWIEKQSEQFDKQKKSFLGLGINTTQ